MSGESKVVDHNSMRHICKNIGTGWRRLGQELGFSESELDIIKMEEIANGYYEVTYKMLTRWKQKTSRMSTNRALVEALKRADQHHLADDIVEAQECDSKLYGTKDASAANREITPTQIDFISEHIAGDWERLAIYLEVDIATIKADSSIVGLPAKSRTMFNKFRQIRGHSATVSFVLYGLTKINRQDLTKEFPDELRKQEMPVSSVLPKAAKEEDPKEIQQIRPVVDRQASNERSSTDMSYSLWEGENINDDADPENCWLCSIGGYYKIRVSNLLWLTDTKGAANLDQIMRVYLRNEVLVNMRSFFDWNGIVKYLHSRLVPKARLKVLFGFQMRDQSTGHFTVLKVFKTSHEQLDYRVIDFQKPVGDPLRFTENRLPAFAEGPYIILETEHDVYYSPIAGITSKVKHGDE